MLSKKPSGKLPPQYNFFLNPYNKLSFTRCPKCEAKTQQRKLPLVIWVDPDYQISLNYSCLYCNTCDLLIADQNKIEGILAQLFLKQAPQVIGNDFTVLGTMEKPAWKQGVEKPLDFQDITAYLHDFKKVLRFKSTNDLGYQESEQVRSKPPSSSDRKAKRAGKEETSAQVSVDNVPKAITLVEKMKLSLPMTARPTKDLVNVLRKRGFKLDLYRDVQIRDVHYMGDEAGITCDITPPGKEKTLTLCSITHLLISPEHPLFAEIRGYQEDRERKLAKDYGLADFTIAPRKHR